MTKQTEPTRKVRTYEHNFSRVTVRTDFQTLQCELTDTDAILQETEWDKKRLPNTLEKVEKIREFLTCILNTNDMPKTINFDNMRINTEQFNK